MKIKTEIIFCFKNYPLLVADENGNFTYNGLPCKKTFVNGTIQIRCSRFKFSKSLIQLRKLAFKKEVIKEKICPF
jgi:hypothetical protein